jgi:hypothetical protein
MSLRFDRFAQPFGGTFYPNPELKPGTSFLIERCRSYIAGLVAARCSDPSAVQIEVSWIANGQFNAIAGIEDGLDCIGINLGAGSILVSLFDNMLSDPECLPEIGDPSIELRHDGFDPATFEVDFSHPSVRKRAHEPKCSVRSKYATSLANAGFYFLFFHELGHIFNGHINWLEQNLGFRALSERGASSILGLDKLTLQTLEMDADSFACDAILMWALRAKHGATPNRPVIPMDTGLGTPLETIFLLVVSIYSVFRIFSDEEIISEESIFDNDHPPAAFRQMYIMATFLAVIEKYGIVEQAGFLECVGRAIGAVEKAFKRMTGRKPAYSSNLDRVSELRSAVLRKLLAHWKALRPQLDPLKRGGVLAP